MQQSPFGLRLLQLAQLQPANASTPQPSSILSVQQRSGVQDLVLRFTPFLTLFALACSLLHLVVRQTRKGRIALPASSDGADLPSTTADDVKVKHDPFDLYDPEVYEDGVPLNETSFWRRVKTYGRLPLLVLSVVVLGVRITILVLPLVQGTNLSTFVLLSDIVAIGYYTYVLSLVFGYQGLTDVPSHWRMTLHIASLFGTIATCKGLETLLPKGDPANKALPTTAIERILDWVELGCVTVATTISVLIPRGPKLYFPMSKLYTSKIAADALTAEQRNGRQPNVSAESDSCIVKQLMFSFATPVVNLAYTSDTLDVHNLPAVPHHMRAMPLFSQFRRIYGLTQKNRLDKRGSGWGVLFKVFVANKGLFITQFILAVLTAGLYYGPAYFINQFVAFLEQDVESRDPYWGWTYVFGLFISHASVAILTGVLWAISSTNLQARIKVQLNTMLFAKTLVRKDVAGGSSAAPSADVGDKAVEKDEKDEEEDVTSKSQVVTLMTVDVDHVADFSFHTFSIIDAPIEIVVGSWFCYELLGVSALVGLLTTCVFLPLNHLASKFVVTAEENLMKARDERTALMNEVLQGINMIKYMSWERSFEKRIQAIREKELRWQRRNYLIEVFFSAIWAATPAFVIIAAFTHYVWWREMPLPPSIAFTAVAVFGELRFALNALPETFISVLQGFVSLRRIEKYLATVEVEPVSPSDTQKIYLTSATIAWPKDKIAGDATAPSSGTSTPKSSFNLLDLTLEFPERELSLICGRLGSGKTLLLLALLGEADLLAGQLVCPRSAPDAMTTFNANPTEEDWIVKNVSAYVPQSAWLRNASIKENILFGSPFRQDRYDRVIEACSLNNDLRILEDGDETEIGEAGLNLSGGQKARVSLARAVYSRASLILLDDVLAAVDSHTAKHIYHKCLKGPLMAGRTVILVSHHVQLCAPGAAFVISLDNGAVTYSGSSKEFLTNGVDPDLLKDDPEDHSDEGVEIIEDVEPTDAEEEKVTAAVPAIAEKRAAPRKLIEDEQRATGRISRDVWLLYLRGCGGVAFWLTLALVLVFAMLAPVLENGWLRHWSESYVDGNPSQAPFYWIGIYSLVTLSGVVLGAIRYAVQYHGSLKASSSIHQNMLVSVLRATVRFHQTESRGRLLNRFGKDMEGVDSSLPDNLLKTIIYALSVATTFASICAVGGLPFAVAAFALGALYYKVGSVYGQSSRDMRRLDSVTRSPLYQLYGETNGGVAVIRGFGASTTSLASLFKAVDTNIVSFYWMWTINRWLSARFNMLSAAVVGATGAAVLVGGSSAATAGFALAFANSVPGDLLFIVRRFVALEQSMVGIERIKQYSELPLEAAEFVEPRPPASWPSSGCLEVKDLEIKYAPNLPTVLHKLSFTVEAGKRCAVVGSTGSGKSTLALALLRLIEAHSGQILLDGLDIANIGLTDLRTKLTIIPQDPTVLSGTLRSTLDVFGEYEDSEIFEALRRVHLLPPEGTVTPAPSISGADEEVNVNVFKNLDSVVSENGENFSQGEKQLICMARAILRRNKLLIMDEATASIDDATDSLVTQTIREEFSNSTILTIAHRLRTIIDFDKVLVLHEGNLKEFEAPHVLLQNPESSFFKLCEATGPVEFAALKKAAEQAHTERQ